MRNAHTILVEKLKGKLLLGKSNRRWANNIKIDNKKQSVKIWAGFNWLRLGSSGRLM
jgi:hypothetical protein